MRPIARTNDLLITKEAGEMYIEDVLNQSYIHLNPTSAFVWERCDGARDTRAIAAEMGEELGVSVSENVVLFALNRLQSERLLTVC